MRMPPLITIAMIATIPYVDIQWYLNAKVVIVDFADAGRKAISTDTETACGE